MRIEEFFRQFPDEGACRSYVRQIREQEGIVCRRCKGDSHYWKSDKEAWQCKACGYRTTLRSGTVMEKSKLPVRYWLSAMMFLSSTRKSYSALEIQRQLNHPHYAAIWAMLHKLRMVMRFRDSRYELTNTIELDEGFFRHNRNKEDKEDQDGKGKRGRGSAKSKVLVAVENVELKAPEKEKKHRGRSSRAGYLKMSVMEDLQQHTITQQVKKDIAFESRVKTDGYSGYSRLKNVVREHEAIIAQNPTEVSKLFPWVHTAISNLRKVLNGIHHSIKEDYLQNYIDEYCYKFNRRYLKEKLFERLVIASVSSTYYQNGYVFE